MPGVPRWPEARSSTVHVHGACVPYTRRREGRGRGRTDGRTIRRARHRPEPPSAPHGPQGHPERPNGQAPQSAYGVRAFNAPTALLGPFSAWAGGSPPAAVGRQPCGGRPGPLHLPYRSRWVIVSLSRLICVCGQRVQTRARVREVRQTWDNAL